MGHLTYGPSKNYNLKKRRIVAVACVFLVAISILGLHVQRTQFGNGIYTYDVSDVRNETLGFAKVFVLSLPGRSDKRDAITLAASLTGITFDWIDGVNGKAIPQKALPNGWPKDQSSSTLGCWRAHMNTMQKIVREQIPSALILEDDADWDVFLKSQLFELAQGTRFLQDANNTARKTSSPYGDDWDLIWVGHCGTRNRETEDGRYYVIQDDPTAIPQRLWAYARRQPNLTPPALRGTHRRVIYEPLRGLCTYGYAVSLRGARRLLYHQALAGHAAASDKALQRICNSRFMGFKCFAPYPAIISSHKAAGATSKDSDREDTRGGFRAHGITEQIVYSTRLNLKQLVGGAGVVKSQWPKGSMFPSANLSMGIPRGHGVFVTTQEYKPFPRPD